MDKLVDEYSNTYHRSIGKKPAADYYSALTNEIETIPKSHKFKVGDRVRITKYKSIYTKSNTENWLKEIFLIDFVLKMLMLKTLKTSLDV